MDTGRWELSSAEDCGRRDPRTFRPEVLLPHSLGQYYEIMGLDVVRRMELITYYFGSSTSCTREPAPKALEIGLLREDVKVKSEEIPV
jgi:hypothetical protein